MHAVYLSTDEAEVNNGTVSPTILIRDASLDIGPEHVAAMRANAKYSREPWQAYHNMWWILNANPGEYCAVGIHGQVIYINLAANTVMAWFSSQPSESE